MSLTFVQSLNFSAFRLQEMKDENTASLRCDLCATYFITPAEWVKHVNRSHTEMELAVENEKL